MSHYPLQSPVNLIILEHKLHNLKYIFKRTHPWVKTDRNLTYSTLKKIFKYGKNLATNEEKPCSTCFKPISPWCFQNPNFVNWSFTTELMRCVLFEKQKEDDLQKFLSVFTQGRFLLKISFGLCNLCSKKIRLAAWKKSLI